MAAYDFGSMSLEQLGNIKITSGKHKGSTVAAASNDSYYVSWCSNRVSSVGPPLVALVTYDFRKKFGAGMLPITLPKAKAKMCSAPPVAVQPAVIEPLPDADLEGLYYRAATLEAVAKVQNRHDMRLAHSVRVQASQYLQEITTHAADGLMRQDEGIVTEY